MGEPTEAERKKAQIARINELSQLARTAWFSMLGYLIFVGITLLGVKDADFFVPSRETQLPLVGVTIPTASFFLAAPILGVALYTYLHLFLIKLWDAHGAARTSDADETHHWLVGDFVLLRLSDPDTAGRPLSWLTDWINRLLVWAAAPLVLGYAWWRSMPAHDELMTLLLGLSFWGTLCVGFASWFRLEDRLTPHGHASLRWWSGAELPSAILAAYLLICVSWMRTEAGFDRYADEVISFIENNTNIIKFTDSENPHFDKYSYISRHKWIENNMITMTDLSIKSEIELELEEIDKSALESFRGFNPLSRTIFSNVKLITLPAEWKSTEISMIDFNRIWCSDPSRHGACNRDLDSISSLEIDSTNTTCGPLTANCNETEFDYWIEFLEYRKKIISTLNFVDLSNQDMRRSGFRSIDLTGVDLSGSSLDGSVIMKVNFEGANLSNS